jgi:hypothetical protein
MSNIIVDNQNQRARKKRMVELAGMLKEKGKGTMVTLERILNKFSMQEGVRLVTSQEYLSIFQSVGLVKIVSGSQKWLYNPDAEWELFTVQI